MKKRRLSYATKSDTIHERIDSNRIWIEQQLGVSLSEAVVMNVSFPLTQIAITTVLNYRNTDHVEADRTDHLAALAKSVSVLPEFMISVDVDLTSSEHDLDSEKKSERELRYVLDWEECPVAINFEGMESTIVALNVNYLTSDPFNSVTETSRLVIVRRCHVEQFLRVLYKSRMEHKKSKLYVGNSSPRSIQTCDWDQIVLDPSAALLLKEDFESFFERRDWFKTMRLPFRRGYLLHGPPGNGKSTAIRAMLTSRGLSAYSLRLFDSQTDDADFDELIERVEQNLPAVILLEDLDRAFPKTGQTRSKLSLQHLLNTLDGVATGEGIIVIATANEPTILDPAILRRPGRFDRVVNFPNPNADLRREYFCRIHPVFKADDLDIAIARSEGFSFAYLREAYILAGQQAFQRKADITVEDLELAVVLLRNSIRQSTCKPAHAGFEKGSRIEANDNGRGGAKSVVGGGSMFVTVGDEVDEPVGGLLLAVQSNGR